MLDSLKRKRRSTRNKAKRRTDGTFLPRGKKAKRKPGTCRCGAYRFPHAKGGGKCRK